MREGETAMGPVWGGVQGQLCVYTCGVQAGAYQGDGAQVDKEGHVVREKRCLEPLRAGMQGGACKFYCMIRRDTIRSSCFR